MIYLLLFLAVVWAGLFAYGYMAFGEMKLLVKELSKGIERGKANAWDLERKVHALSAFRNCVLEGFNLNGAGLSERSTFELVNSGRFDHSEFYGQELLEKLQDSEKEAHAVRLRIAELEKTDAALKDQFEHEVTNYLVDMLSSVYGDLEPAKELSPLEKGLQAFKKTQNELRDRIYKLEEAKKLKLRVKAKGRRK